MLDADNGTLPAGIPSETGTSVAAQTNAATTDAQTGGADGGNQGQEQEKTFTQKELDDILQKRIAKAEARAERRVLRTLERVMPQTQTQPAAQHNGQPADGRPTRQQGESDDAYLDRLTDWKLEQREAIKQQQELGRRTESLYKEAAKLPDFDRDSFDELPLTREIVAALVDADNAPALMQYMAANPEEVERIAALRPSRQAAEVGKLEVKLAAMPPTTKPSKAPEPIAPVGKRSTSSASNGPSDDMDMETWARAERERERKRRA